MTLLPSPPRHRRRTAGRYGESRRRRQWRDLGLGLVLLASFPAAARAAGFWSLERGTSSFARGGANVASPMDPIAVYMNPAALAGLEGIQLTLDGNWVFDHRQFTRAPDDRRRPGTVKAYGTIENSWRPLAPSPGLFGAIDGDIIGVPELALGFGLWGPLRVDREMPADGPQRYGEITAHNLQIHYALAAAYELPFWHLRIGATGMVVSQILKTRLKLNAAVIEDPFQPENPDDDVDVDVDARDHGIPCGILGLSAEPLEGLVIGASVQRHYDVEAEGKAAVSLGRNFKRLAAIEGDQIGAEFHMPTIARAGVQLFAPEHRWDGELAFVWEGWTRTDQVRFVPDDIRVTSTTLGAPIVLQPVLIDFRLRNTYSLRGGGSYALTDSVRLRAGAFWERGAARPRRINMGGFDLDKTGATAGARLELPHALWVDLAGGFILWKDTTVKDSKIRLVNPLYPDVEKHSVADGDYGNRQVYVMAALGVRI